VHLLLGRLEMREGSPERARPHLEAALAFFAGQEEQVMLATAHNEMGDFHLAQGGPHLQRALDHYSRALQAARSSRPPNSYYECAALVNICRARIRGGLPAAELATGRDGPSGSEGERGVEALIEQARELGRTHRYVNHRARLSLLEAEWALKRGDLPTAQRATGEALHLAHNFSPHLLAEVRAELHRLGLPHGLTDVLAADPDLA
jgi:tetratricopeptide (TPR) repeat protein